MKEIRLWLVGLLAIVMITLYAWQVVSLSMNALNCDRVISQSEKQSADVESDSPCVKILPTSRFKTLLMTLQGLVSSLVIAVLAITPVQRLLNLSFLGLDPNRTQLTIVDYVGLAYLFIWVTTGGFAVMVGYILIGDAAAEKFGLLLDIGWTWFALAVGAAYSFLGIKPD